jgi:hypothetical protein
MDFTTAPRHRVVKILKATRGSGKTEKKLGLPGHKPSFERYLEK